MKPTAELPDDPTLPAIASIRSDGLAATIPALGLGDGPVELLLRGYSRGERATIEARAGDRRFAIKVYARDPTPEATLYEALAGAGLAGATWTGGARVPPLLAWQRDLRVLVIGWLAGPTAHELVKGGQGERAGELAAHWFRRAASLSVKLGPPIDPAHMLKNAEVWIAILVEAHPELGQAATALAEKLAHTRPREAASHLVHGTLYDRHILDTPDGPGVIDWQRFGQGPLEFDAATFLTTISRIGLRDPDLSREANRAEAAFLNGTQGLLDERVLTWCQAVAFLRLASKPVGAAGDARLQAKGKADRRAVAIARSRQLLAEATRCGAGVA